MTLFRSVLALCGGLVLAGCNTAAEAPAVQPASQGATPQYVTRSDFRLPEGTGCSGEIARFRAVMDNDLQTGHVNREVHGRVIADLRGPEQACAGGRDGEARGGLRTVKSRYGYP
ncbi:MAG: hypothetical protein ACRCVA_30015 [Phreatobacter sp.]